MFKVPERYRVSKGVFASDSRAGNNGHFIIKNGRTDYHIIVSDGEGWEHVSVHCTSNGKERTPTWSEMCHTKDLFWDKQDVVLQFHPAESDYVNMHKHVLHLWRQVDVQVITPPMYLV